MPSELNQTAPSSESNSDLEAKIEAILFWKGEPVKLADLAKFLNEEKEAVEISLAKLKENLAARGSGLTIVENDDGVMLYTAPNLSDLIKDLTKEELSKNISKSETEVLSLVLYRGPIAKSDIDYIRGVNSSYSLRNLMVRGLVERDEKASGRSFVYRPTFELFAHLGVTKKEELPDFESVTKDIAAFVAQNDQTDQNNG